MKRSLALMLVLSLAATLLYVFSASAQTGATVVRGTPLQVTNTTTPRRDRTLPYTFTTTGRVIPPPRYCTPGQTPGRRAANCIPVLCPAGVTDPRYCVFPGRGVICSGSVTVRVQKRGTTISSPTVALRPDCTFISTVTFRTRLRTRTGILSFQARFAGNSVMLPKNSATKSARAG